MLNIAWITSRKDSCFDWAIESLARQLNGDFKDVRVIVVDFWAQVMKHHNWGIDDVRERVGIMRSICPTGLEVIFTPPKPCVWQGQHRLTKNDYFAASNARNTALCFAKDGHLAYVDDLSVLCSEWLKAVREACGSNRITAGAFKKLKNILVVNGEVKSFDPFPPGMDSRWQHGKDEPVECPAQWTFGCSLVAPVERFLELNGWPEMADSSGIAGEDTAMGVAWKNRGHKIWYDRRMLTYESEERHHNQNVMLRLNKKRDGAVRFFPDADLTPNHKDFMLVAALSKATQFKNYFEEGGIRALRDKILSGKPFPIHLQPRHCWFDNQPVTEL